MTAKEIFLKIKAAFDMPMPPAPAPAPAVPVTPIAKTYKLQDGTEISITQAGDIPAAGDTVTIGGAPAPANTYTLADGSTITVDATGMITVYTAMAAPPAAQPAPAPVVPVTLTAEAVQEMYLKFATGSTEERMANLETMVKALMECSFGYEIRKGIEQEAVQAYKDSVALQVSNLMASSQTAIDEQKVINTRQQETIAGLFELVEKLVEMPTADPLTLTELQKAKFERMSAKEQRLQKMAEALKNQKALA
jgi:hypothetical protein